MLDRLKKFSVNKSSQITVDNIDVQIIRKKIKNLHLRVCPPDGCVRVTAPSSVKDDEIRFLVAKRFSWIRKQQLRLASRVQPKAYEMIPGESHYYLGKSYLLEVIVRRGKQEVILEGSTLLLYVREDTSVDKRVMILNKWYRQEIKKLIPELIKKWQPIMAVKVDDWRIKKMKTRWGTCNISAHRIWLNLELIKKPMACLEYVLVHEMVHLLERNHTQKFKAYMDEFLPDWRLQDEYLKNEPSLRYI